MDPRRIPLFTAGTLDLDRVGHLLILSPPGRGRTETLLLAARHVAAHGGRVVHGGRQGGHHRFADLPGLLTCTDDRALLEGVDAVHRRLRTGAAQPPTVLALDGAGPLLRRGRTRGPWHTAARQVLEIAVTGRAHGVHLLLAQSPGARLERVLLDNVSVLQLGPQRRAGLPGPLLAAASARRRGPWEGQLATQDGVRPVTVNLPGSPPAGRSRRAAVTARLRGLPRPAAGTTADRPGPR